MSERKHKQPTDEQPAAGDSTPSQPVNDAATADLQSLQAQLRAAETAAAENLDGWQRALAEFQNYKKRVERDRIADQEMMRADLIRRFLPVLDDLERALSSSPQDNPWMSGVELIRRKLQALLEAEGVKRIEAEGAVFDPNFHEAISQEPVDGMESGRIVAVTLNGYTLGERVIRPAQVRVAA